jgi:predicted nuclease of restriction endonuclease-like (RecB) superfamily
MQTLYPLIAQIIKDARAKAYQAVNSAMVQAYWYIGQQIVEEEQAGKHRAEYGTGLLKYLSEKLTADFGTGFNVRNLAYMKQFYTSYPILHAVRAELSWTHYRLLLKVQNEKAREFYLNEAIDNQWSTRSLERQINTFYYERLLSSQDRKPVRQEAEENTTAFQPADVIKDPYILEFLQLKENTAFLEKELETALIGKLQDFLLELGKGFSFVARQRRITAEGSHFYIDLVFYNYILKCFVLIDLKMGELTHQDIGQMDFYVRFWEDQCKTEGDNPTIGIILCSEKNNTIVKYSVLENSQTLFASKYMLYLPTEAELKAELEREKLQIEMEKRLK